MLPDLDLLMATLYEGRNSCMQEVRKVQGIQLVNEYVMVNKVKSLPVVQQESPHRKARDVRGMQLPSREWGPPKHGQ